MTSRLQPMPQAPDMEAFAEDQARFDYMLGLHHALGRIPNVPLPDVAIGGITDRLKMWTYRREGPYPGIHYLSRQALDPMVRLGLQDLVRGFDAPARSTHIDEAGVTIKIEHDTVRGRDFLAVLEIETQYPSRLRIQEIETMRRGELDTKAAAEFRESKNVYVNDGDVLTDRETVVFQHMTHHTNSRELADALEIETRVLNKVLRPLADKLGIEVHTTHNDFYVELMLAAIGLGTAKIDHLPAGFKSQQEGLTEEDVKLLSHYYSPDQEQREEARRLWTDDAISSRWSKIYRKLRVGDRGEAVQFAVRNDILQVPDRAAVYELLARGRAET